jgi:hypothetical protein
MIFINGKDIRITNFVFPRFALGEVKAQNAPFTQQERGELRSLDGPGGILSPAALFSYRIQLRVTGKCHNIRAPLI